MIKLVCGKIITEHLVSIIFFDHIDLMWIYIVAQQFPSLGLIQFCLFFYLRSENGRCNKL